MAKPSAGTECVCGGTYTASTRYDVLKPPIYTVCCFECGREYPPLDTCCNRPRPVNPFVTLQCMWCKESFRTQDPIEPFCSDDCDRRATEFRHRFERTAS
jgi:hypothetical protein